MPSIAFTSNIDSQSNNQLIELEDGSTFVADERYQRQLMLAQSSNGFAGVATHEERIYYYHLGKKGMGFTPEDRRHIWL